jgi:dihydroorotase
MCDCHIHGRECSHGGQNHKEDLTTASRAATHGGVVAVADMPNKGKPVTTQEDMNWQRNRVEQIAEPTVVITYLGIGDEKSGTRPLGEQGAYPYKVYFGQSVGSLTVKYGSDLDKVLANYKGQDVSFHIEYQPIIDANSTGKTHTDRRPRECVNEGLRLVLPLIEKHKLRAKLCHWSTGNDSFEQIAEYRSKGCEIDLEVSPLHLVFDSEMAKQNPELWTKIQMNPAIQSPQDRIDLIEGLRSGFVTMLATDHAPHTEEEKFSAFAKFRKAGTHTENMTNLEIAKFVKATDQQAYLDTCCENGHSGAPWLLIVRHGFTPQEIARVTGYNPGKFINKYLQQQYPNRNFGKGFGILESGYYGSATVLKLGGENTIVDQKTHKTKVAWSPLEGMDMGGSVAATFQGGKRIK